MADENVQDSTNDPFRKITSEINLNMDDSREGQNDRQTQSFPAPTSEQNDKEVEQNNSGLSINNPESWSNETSKDELKQTQQQNNSQELSLPQIQPINQAPEMVQKQEGIEDVQNRDQKSENVVMEDQTQKQQQSNNEQEDLLENSPPLNQNPDNQFESERVQNPMLISENRQQESSSPTRPIDDDPNQKQDNSDSQIDSRTEQSQNQQDQAEKAEEVVAIQSSEENSHPEQVQQNRQDHGEDVPAAQQFSESNIENGGDRLDEKNEEIVQMDQEGEAEHQQIEQNNINEGLKQEIEKQKERIEELEKIKEENQKLIKDQKERIERLENQIEESQEEMSNLKNESKIITDKLGEQVTKLTSDMENLKTQSDEALAKTKQVFEDQIQKLKSTSIELGVLENLNYLPKSLDETVRKLKEFSTNNSINEQTKQTYIAVKRLLESVFQTYRVEIQSESIQLQQGYSVQVFSNQSLTFPKHFADLYNMFVELNELVKQSMKQMTSVFSVTEKQDITNIWNEYLKRASDYLITKSEPHMFGELIKSGRDLLNATKGLLQGIVQLNEDIHKKQKQKVLELKVGQGIFKASQHLQEKPDLEQVQV